MQKLLLLLFLACSLVQAQKAIPNIELKNEEGKIVNISKQTNETLKVYSFWATWCMPCINELDAINENYSDWKDEIDVDLVAISIDDARTASKVVPLLNGKEWEFEILFDTNHKLKRALNIDTIPYLIIVKDNKIVYEHLGYTPGFEFDLFDKIKELAN
jgi:peroxiredoxin